MRQEKIRQNVNPANTPSVDVANLISLYDIARLQLHQCGLHEYGEDETLDAEMAEKEIRALSQQEEVIVSAAAAPMRSEEDIKNLLRLWKREQPESEDEMMGADHLILTIYEHFGLG